MNRSRLAALSVCTAGALFASLGQPAEAELIEVTTPLGSFTMQTREDAAPNTVANFLKYINDGDFDDSFIHRVAKTADSGVNVIQGGGFRVSDAEGLTLVPTDAPIANEFSLSNVRGTVAMARQGGNADSATSQWFVNTTDNLALDSIDGGFTVFAEVVEGMDVVDAIYDLTIYNGTSMHPAFTNLPLVDEFDNSRPVIASDFVSTSFAITPEPSSLALLGMGGLLIARQRRG